MNLPAIVSAFFFLWVVFSVCSGVGSYRPGYEWTAAKALFGIVLFLAVWSLGYFSKPD